MGDGFRPQVRGGVASVGEMWDASVQAIALQSWLGRWLSVAGRGNGSWPVRCFVGNGLANTVWFGGQ